ncbi:HIT family protein [Falsarthrobacter nasiphocae]|uniref:Histidine triad (HIT) family protein n=1 Tax=Falsarthrobacter nasiphocae TaxID=189863 RepID=A0AAE3YIA1_9MICC|nr:HIT family protein [Falsarthrobacter nasiphocae]MDR6892438.1 histidine triad (HIT) family protein [Falsarthrobacter nasiphocae]
MTAVSEPGGPASSSPERLSAAAAVAAHPDLFPSHAPHGYACPYCGLRDGDTSDPRNLCEPGDLVWADGEVLVLIASHGFEPRPGHPMVVPREHTESLYRMTDAQLAAVSRTVRDVAVAVKIAWGCEGVTIRQNNEPHGSQHVWHYHDHVIPRWADDGWGRGPMRRPIVPPHRRAELALELREALLRVRGG